MSLRLCARGWDKFSCDNRVSIQLQSLDVGKGSEKLAIESVSRFVSDEKKMFSGDDLVKNSTLYREFQAEREEILKQKWIESEKVGYDIGFERALTDWIIKHRSKWRKSRQALNTQVTQPAN